MNNDHLTLTTTVLGRAVACAEEVRKRHPGVPVSVVQTRLEPGEWQLRVGTACTVARLGFEWKPKQETLVGLILEKYWALT